MFKTYVCNQHPTLSIGTPIKEGSGHVVIKFGTTIPGLYTAKSREEEQMIEKSSSYGLTVFPFDQGKDAEEIRTREEVGDVVAPRRIAIQRPPPPKTEKGGHQRKG